MLASRIDLQFRPTTPEKAERTSRHLARLAQLKPPLHCFNDTEPHRRYDATTNLEGSVKSGQRDKVFRRSAYNARVMV